MDLTTWAFIFLAISIVMLIAEIFLPSHGMLGLLGGAAIVACIIVCFRINQYLGLGALLAAAVASPFLFTLAMRIWPRTPIGRRMTLQPVESHVTPPAIQIGQIGTALTQLRPMGTCEFGQQRVEVRSELGMIPAGSKVEVVNIDGGRLIVRKV